MSRPVRPQEELFPWEEPEQKEPKSASAAQATARAQSPVDETEASDSLDSYADEPEALTIEPDTEKAERATGIAIEGEASPGAADSDDGVADDPFDFEGAAALLERLERDAGLAPVDPRERPAVAPREYYAISEVCDLVGLKPHVLRYWEAQFPLLNPSKNRSGNRVYQRKEIKLILLVKHLLYEEKYTIEGAKAQMDRLRRGGDLGERTAAALAAETLGLVREEVDALYRLLTPREPV